VEKQIFVTALMSSKKLGVWFPVISAGTGVDIFTERLIIGLQNRGIRAEASWLPPRAEYLPWTVSAPPAPEWASVVHVNSWLHKRFVPTNLPCVATFHSFVHEKKLREYKKPLQAIYHRFWVERCERNMIKRASELTGVSEYACSANAKYFDCGCPKTIHNWIDTSLFKPSTYQAPRNPFKLLYVGKISRLKGVNLFRPIMEQLGDDFELSVTGSKRELDELGASADNIFALGKIKNTQALIELYQRSDALLFPTLTEGFGLAALEAQACGLPVITSSCTSLPEVVKDRETGFLCETADVQEFVDAIRTLLDYELHQSLSSNAVRWASSTFPEDEAIDRYLKLYQSLLRTNHPYS
jgi:glycosyltransferase involved in cell wall biosynthesis